jgi:CheY-like chemotaxis protein
MSENAQGNAEAPPYVIVVDDDAAVLRLHATVVRGNGYEVDTATSGEEALELVQQRCPDALVSDLMLGNMHGEELARRCFALCPKIRLIFVSGFSEETLREVGITQVVYLPKPVPPATLRSTLRALIGR